MNEDEVCNKRLYPSFRTEEDGCQLYEVRLDVHIAALLLLLLHGATEEDGGAAVTHSTLDKAGL